MKRRWKAGLKSELRRVKVKSFKMTIIKKVSTVKDRVKYSHKKILQLLG